ncbi:type II toxin-antitoxin system VapC family toxin [Enterovirga rhinocerotis]|uniref:Ribonuclease VapC n=1 Tax=Enterovirga rhinocerotis TaxID=1339210 RepID=A0A4R7BV84_9HYPH|nr:PIN domain nuclease [Enterovirga rhinocerotis]TDR89734.1 hypothetical protein EV668_2569 [Enterovirga rhinocerotis]
MILVDSSVWIALLRSQNTAAVTRLRSLIDPGSIIVGDLILLEILQGARDDPHAARLERHLRRFPIVAMLDEEIAVEGARLYRRLRASGVTVRKTADIIIGAFCLLRGHSLLHDDRDFSLMAPVIGLRCV